MSDAQTRETNLLIIRRGGAAELETPKGGVWKIAYADFMTAMMAFFLVMWLINATSETTKTGVANYFNPIKLADGMQLPKKGLLDPEDGANPKGEEASGHDPAHEISEHAEAEATEAEESEHKSSEKKARFSEEALFRDPYAVLAAIAAEAEGATSGGGGAGSVGGGGGDRAGEIYGDPFDPAAWQVSAPAAALEADAGGDAVLPIAAGQGGTDASHQVPDAEPAADLRAAAGEIAAGAAQIAREAAGGDELAEEQPPAGVAGEAMGEHASGTAREPTEAHAAGSAGDIASDEQAAGDTEDDAQTGPLQKRIAEALELGSPQAPNVTVESADGGVLISLADQVEFGMFAVGSSEPLPETIAVMEKIAALLNTVPGKVIIRGHTDGRPFRSGEYDNWRLSFARAQMAYHMLVRGGLDDSRVERIEGYADRALKLPGDPEAAENRRIDILVQEVES